MREGAMCFETRNKSDAVFDAARAGDVTGRKGSIARNECGLSVTGWKMSGAALYVEGIMEMRGYGNIT